MRLGKRIPFLAAILFCMLLLLPVLRVSASDSASTSEAQQRAENEDGDRDYITNDGTLITIPTVDPAKEEIYDYAGLLTEEEKKWLNERRLRLEGEKDCDIVILTLAKGGIPHDLYDGSETTRAYAEQFYMDNGFADDAILFTIDMENREIQIGGHGRYDSDSFQSRIKTIYENVKDPASDGKYADAVNAFLTEVDIIGNIRYAMMPSGASLIISGVLALLTILVFLRQHRKIEALKHSPAGAEAKDYRVLVHDVRYLGTTRTVRRIPKQSSGGGSGGGFSGGRSSGGGFSGGGGGFSGGGGKF